MAENERLIKNGAKIIQDKIDLAIKDNKTQVVISGDYEIEKAIVLPPHFTIILQDVYLRLKDDTFCNIFINRSSVQEVRTSEQTDYDIHIIGVGRAVLDGGKFNGLNERNAAEKGMPMTVNNLILLTNVEVFSISGIQLRNQRWWSINLMYCRNGRISNVDICADDSILYVEGERNYEWGYIDLANKYIDLLRNADGIDVRVGCHDLLIENITGFTEDDTVALTGLLGNVNNKYAVKDLSPDIYNVIIRNVKSSSWCANIRLLNQGGIKLYNILIDGVIDTSKDSKHMNRGLYGVRVGDKHLYSTRHSTPDETYNIVIKNVYSRAKQAINLAGSITDCVIQDVFGFDGNNKIIENTANLFGKCKILD